MILATNNKGKLEEIRKILEDYKFFKRQKHKRRCWRR